ncbi:MAG: hypothetical protein H6618_01905 [Deltaproteobacteria bacterium]|nr:hypothetical protein [Deltaproteobacteria bacterium]
MKFLYNNKINKILSEANIANIETLRTTIPTELEELLSEGVENVEDCIFLKCNVGNLSNVKKTDFPDNTGLECFVNKINIDNYTDDDPSVSDMLKIGISAINLIKCYLQNKDDKFAIIYSVQDDDFIAASLRFHKCRDGETWISDNLEGYEDATLVAYVN